MAEGPGGDKGTVLVTRRGKAGVALIPEFIEDPRRWIETDRRTALRAFDLIDAVTSDPFAGIGKPEPLKHLTPGVWSRRLIQEYPELRRLPLRTCPGADEPQQRR